MIPILYEQTETSFTSNGLGRLSDCIRCVVTEGRNDIYEAEFDYPVTGVNFDKITIGRIIACTHDEQGDVQPFDIYHKTEPINGIVTFYARHISYRLNEIVAKPFTATSCVDAMAKAKTQSIGTNPFTFWTNKSVTATFVSSAPRQIRNMLGGEENSFLDVFGTGEYEFDKFTVKLHLHRGQDTNVSIRYGKNLIDYTNDYDAGETYTAVVPYWLGDVMEDGAEESTSVLVTLPEWYIESGYASAFGREVIVPMNLSDVFAEPPTEEQLRSTATSRLSNSDAWLPNQTVTVNFVQLWQTEEYKDYAPLQRLRLCDTCGVFVPMYDTAVRAKVIRVVYNVLLDRYDEMELGDKPITYSAVLEKMYDSKVAGVVAGLQSVNVDIQTVAQNAQNWASEAEANAKYYSDDKLASAVLDINSDLDDIRDQIDGNITTWFFSVDPTMSNPPVAYDESVEGSGWDTDEKKNNHLGDLYYNTATGNAWRFVNENGTYSWSALSNSDVAEALRLASEAKDTADSKRRVFYTTPVPPYDQGDLWVQGDEGDILRCATAKDEGESYSSSDWVLASKYTDDSTFEAWVDGSFATIIADIGSQIDAKIETWAQTANPASDWTTTEVRTSHNGDLWLYTGINTITVGSTSIKPQGVYQYDGATNTWSEYASTSDNLFDLVDGKTTIFYGTTSGSYANKQTGDYLVDSSTGATYRWAGSAWQKVTDYQEYTTDQITALNALLSTQIDARIETWVQETNPAANWSTVSEKKSHTGDLWLYTGLSNITVYGATIKPQGTYEFKYIEADSLADESAVELADESGVVIETNEENAWSAYSSISNNIYDLADGKSTIYYGSTSGSYDADVGDYLVDSSTGSTYRWNGSSWVKQTDYQTAISSAKTTIESQYEQAIEDATELIRGGTGGYVVTTVNADGQPIEILITDNLDLNQAVNVWRWNKNGLAHSSSGYNGTYSDFAITKDGKINASRILTGAMTANLITAGTISDTSGLNYWNLESGQFVTKQGTIGPFALTSNYLEYTSPNLARVEISGGGLELRQKTYWAIDDTQTIAGIDVWFGNIYFVDNQDLTDLYTNRRVMNIYLGRYANSTTKYDVTIQNPIAKQYVAQFRNWRATAKDYSIFLYRGVYIEDGGLRVETFTDVVGNLWVGGTKSRKVSTENYSERLQYCYETPTPMFGDIGEAVLDSDGFCYIDIDDIFTETIAEQVEYQVFLQKEGRGDCWVADKQQRYFVIEGTPNLKVAWELKAKQKDYENIRLEQWDIDLDEYEDVTETASLIEDFITEQEDLLYG